MCHRHFSIRRYIYDIKYIFELFIIIIVNELEFGSLYTTKLTSASHQNYSSLFLHLHYILLSLNFH